MTKRKMVITAFAIMTLLFSGISAMAQTVFDSDGSINSNILLVTKTAQGLQDDEARDTLLKRGVRYIEDFVDIAFLIKSSTNMKTRFNMAVANLGFIAGTKQLLALSELIKNEYHENGDLKIAYRDMFLSKGLSFLKNDKCNGNCSGCPNSGNCPGPGEEPGHEDDKCNGNCSGCPNSGNCPGPGEEPGHEDDKCNGNCSGCPNSGNCPGPGEEPGHEDDKCNGNCSGCPNSGNCPGPGGEPGHEDDKVSAFFDPFVEEALKVRILSNSSDTQARKLLLDIFRRRKIENY